MNKGSGCDDDYYDAAERHRRDAELLFKAGRMANADHLYGLAAECLLKAFWEKHFPVYFAQNKQKHCAQGKQKRKFPHMDKNKLWDAFKFFMDGRIETMLPQYFLEDCPYNDWHISQRYCTEGVIMPERVEVHRKWTIRAFNMLIEHC
ncbi:MAG: hypothetical protein HQL84_03375 [Magnetococcales bacterium]|nr:hypothetical protein [Magnetococcales bacterium]MBF0149067.1 hypothetical protein [Magnetococcales bacterium]MBF0173904.1 hypothetical protein [Magnetococcales bacterium]